VIALVALAGGLGACLRFLVERSVSRRARMPLGTLVVNVTGSFALGLAVALLPDGDALAVLGTGLLGGYTTCSAASVEALALARESLMRGAVHAAAMLGLSLAAAALGLWIG